MAARIRGARSGFHHHASNLEHWALYPRLIESGGDEISAKGQAFKQETGCLAPAFLAYCDK